MASSYLLQIEDISSSMLPLSLQGHALALIWTSWEPSKTLVFSWKLLQDRFPSCSSLFKIGVFSDPSKISCPFFPIESTSHLFMTCEIASFVWYRVFRWLGWQVVIHQGLIGLFHIFNSLGGRYKFRCSFLMV